MIQFSTFYSITTSKSEGKSELLVYMKSSPFTTSKWLLDKFLLNPLMYFLLYNLQTHTYTYDYTHLSNMQNHNNKCVDVLSDYLVHWLTNNINQILCFFSNLIHFYFSFYIYNFLQLFSTCFGPAGPSSGESNYTCSIWHLSL